MRALLVFSLLALLGASVAYADAPRVTPPPPPSTTPPPTTTVPPAPWRDLYHQGSVAYDAGRLDEALADFQQARSLGGPPTLLYDIALTLDRLGRTDEAVATYHQYLDAAPEASNRDVVEARLAEIAAASARRSVPTAPSGPIFTPLPTDAPAPPAATTTTASTTYVTHSMATEDHWEPQGPEWVASWVMLALTAGTSVAAVLVWQDGLARFQELQDLCASMDGCTRSDIDQSSAHTSQDATNALLGVSIGLGAITLLTFVVEGVVTGNRMRFVRAGARRDDHEPHFAFGPLGLSISGTF